MNKKIAMFCLCVVIAIFVIPSAIFAASFDCSKAKTETEKAICDDPILSIFDEHMALAFSKALKSPDREYVRKEQRKWLKEVLGQCGGDKSCIKEAYKDRLHQLDYEISLGGAIVDIETEEEDLTRTLTITCKYSDYETSQFESVSIEQTTKKQGKFAATKNFKKGKSQHESEIFLVRPGQFAECIYPSGTRVRVKVGEGSSYPYGACGADPEVFMSLWVNERKIASRVWFAGHCRESRREKPAVSFNITGLHNSVAVQKCHTVRQEGSNLVPESGNTKKGKSEPLSVCVNFPDVSKYPKDFLEYPPKGTQKPKVGDIEILNGSGPVCQVVLDELKGKFHTFFNYPDQSKTKPSPPNWNETSVELPKQLAGSSESIFDFNNDGKLDRVFSRDYAHTYMDGDVLLVQYGHSASRLDVSDSPMEEASGFFPCQMGKVRPKIYDCPPFSQENDEAGFYMKGRNDKDEVYFRARYSTIVPFKFQGTTYIAVWTVDWETEDFVAVLKPLPDGTFQQIGLFRRVSENF